MTDAQCIAIVAAVLYSSDTYTPTTATIEDSVATARKLLTEAMYPGSAAKAKGGAAHAAEPPVPEDAINEYTTADGSGYP